VPKAAVTPGRTWRSAYVAAKHHRWAAAHRGFFALAEREGLSPDERKFARAMIVAIEAAMARAMTDSAAVDKP
jgi:hypothetical protein